MLDQKSLCRGSSYPAVEPHVDLSTSVVVAVAFWGPRCDSKGVLGSGTTSHRPFHRHLVTVQRTKTTSHSIIHNVANRARVQCARDGPGTLGSRKPGCAKRKPRAYRSIRSISTGTIFHKRTGSFAFCRHIGEPSGRPFCHEACGAPTAIHSGAGIRQDATHVYVAARSGASKSASLPIPRHPICSRA